LAAPRPNHDSEWCEILENAIAASSSPAPGLLAFLEEREDLRVTSATGADTVSAHSRIRGLSVRPGWDMPRLLHRSDPGADDVEPLVRAAGDPRTRFPSRVAGGGRPPSILEGLDSMAAAAFLSELIGRIASHDSRIEARASWIGHVQRVWVAQQGRPVVTDLRQGRRVRVDARLHSGGCRSQAAAEAVLPAEGNLQQTMTRLTGELVARLERRLTARPAPAGAWPVVLAAGVSGILVHELVGHALEADAALRGTWLSSLEGQVAPPSLVILDDPRRARAAWKLDDEGERVRATRLIGGGKVAGRLHDQRTARATGQKPTGHGRRSSHREPVGPRMGCTFVAAGARKPQELLEGIDRGIFVRRMESASTDPETGTAVFRVTDADAIRFGRLESPLRPHLIRVDGAATLLGIDGTADDVKFDTCVGSCQRGGQPLAISVGGPTMRIGLATVVN